MSDTKENYEAGQGDPPVVDSQIIGESSNQASTSQQLSDDHQIIMDNLAGLEPYLDQEMNLEAQPEVLPVTVEGIELKPVTVEQIELKPVTVEEIEFKPVTVEETSKNVENGSSNIENKKEESPAEDANVKPTVVSEEENAQDCTLHSVPVEAEAQILNTTKGEAASDMMMEVKELPQSNEGIDSDDTVCQNSVGDTPPKSDKSAEIENDGNVCQISVGDAPPRSDKGVENDDNICQNSVGDAPPKSEEVVENDDNVCQNSVGDAFPKSDKSVEIENDDNVCQSSVGDAPPKSDKGVENDDNLCQNSVSDVETTAVKLEVREAANTKICDGDPMPSSQNDPTTPQHAPSGTKPELKNVLEVENKADEKQAADPVDNGNSNSKNMFFLDADHFYDGNESGTEEEQSAFMKELESFFRERSMEFKPPKFYGEGLNCLK